MSNELAKKTISSIQKALGDRESQGVNEVIQIIQELASKAFSISVSELSDLIERDKTITEKVIGAANTLGFNPSGTPITTITEAIHTVGFEKIRNLSISIMLVENAGTKLSEEEQREMAAISVCSGLMAQQLVEQVDSPIDSDLAFVCTSLRNYGKLLMTSFLIDDYREAKAMASGLENDDEAFRKVFGLTPLQLGQALLNSSNLPTCMMASLNEMPQEVLDGVARTPEDQIVVIAELCVKVCETTFDGNIAPEDFQKELAKVVEDFHQSLPIDLEMIQYSINQIDTNLSVLNQALGQDDFSSSFTGRIRARISGDPVPSRAIRQEKKRIQKGGRPSPEKEIRKAAKLVEKKRTTGGKVDMKEIYEAIAKSFQVAMDLDNCLIFVNDDNESKRFSARFGFGPLFNKIRNRPLVSRDKRDVFGICIGKRGDILIQDASAGKIKSVIPGWLAAYGQASSFILLPAICDTRLFAIIFGTVSENKTIEPSPKDLHSIQEIRNGLSKLMQQIESNEIEAQ